MAVSQGKHPHVFDEGNPIGARNARRVVILTATMMVVEITAGMVYGSMALLADGWHMSTHAAALGVTSVAYTLARRHREDSRFSFGTWKIETLGGFASAVVLGVVAAYMALESFWRLFQPHSILYDQALVVAAVGLAVNLVCAFLLGQGGGHSGSGPHASHHHDVNLKSAYLHVIADAMTSVAAIVALMGGRLFNWSWLDPTMGLVGSVVVGTWAYSLIRDAGRILLDREMDLPIVQGIRASVEADGLTRLTDLHLVRVGRQQFACVLSVKTGAPMNPDDYKALLRQYPELVHITVEVVQEIREFART
jgi:cation diffusion facilitator family transporter